jgi:uncharacterized protein
MNVRQAIVTALLSCAAATGAAQSAPAGPVFDYREVMVPMRDGVLLQTVILTPVGRHPPLPIMLSRSPYGVPSQAPDSVPPNLRALARDGYVFVLQNVRGRFKSQGHFAVSTSIDPDAPTAVSDATDAYDTIEWLIQHVPDNNGKVGMYGVSYAGMTAALALLEPHPALRAVSEQGAAADEWMNDDFHHYGALRLSYAFEYAVREQADRQANAPFDFNTNDTYDWYLKLGSLSNVNDRYLHGALSFWNDVVDHPDYDAYWKKDAWAAHLRGGTVPVLNVAGYWDQEDPWGPWEIYRRLGASGSAGVNLMVAGPWTHGAWERDPKGDRLGSLSLGGHETSREFREDIEAPFFRYFLHGTGDPPQWRVKSFRTGSQTWCTYPSWPPPQAKATSLYFHSDGSLSFESPVERSSPYREYVSNPADPVPYRQRPISPIAPAGGWAQWQASDQRFLGQRPDVLTYVSAPLDHPVTMIGAVRTELFASTSGTDSDFIVKLIDVAPEDGYELPIAMEVRRGRYNVSYEHPAPLKPGEATAWDVPLGDHDHVFQQGHRIMVQVQSTWFPLIDRNPQTFVPSIYRARDADFVSVTQRVYSSPRLPSHIVMPLLPGQLSPVCTGDAVPPRRTTRPADARR